MDNKSIKTNIENNHIETIIRDNLSNLIGEKLFYVKVPLEENKCSRIIMKNKPLSKLHLLQQDEMLYMNNQIVKLGYPVVQSELSNRDNCLFFIVIFGENEEFKRIIKNFPNKTMGLQNSVLWTYMYSKDLINSIEKIIFSNCIKPAKRY